MVVNIQMLEDITKLLRILLRIDRSLGELFVGMPSLWISQVL